MTRKERIRQTAVCLVYCYDQGHDVLNLPAVLNLYRTYCLETCESALELAKQMIEEREK